MSSDAPAPSDLSYEQAHVHDVYEQIAPHFSSTRYKPWPLIERFLNALPPGSVGLDAGCGNGKYLAVNPHVYMLASDRSSNLTRIAAERSRAAERCHDTLVADCLALPHPRGAFDFALSVAVVHHLSTRERRVEAIRALLEPLCEKRHARGGGCGKALIYVWALEQKDSRRGWGEGDAQDVMVPWVMHAKKRKDGDTEQDDGSRTFQRYYHLYRHGELEEDIRQAGGAVLESGYEKDNWWAIAAKTDRDAASSSGVIES